MFCEKCGKELADGSKFCDACGTQQGAAAVGQPGPPPGPGMAPPPGPGMAPPPGPGMTPPPGPGMTPPPGPGMTPPPGPVQPRAGYARTPRAAGGDLWPYVLGGLAVIFGVLVLVCTFLSWVSINADFSVMGVEGGISIKMSGLQIMTNPSVMDVVEHDIDMDKMKFNPDDLNLDELEKELEKGLDNIDYRGGGVKNISYGASSTQASSAQGGLEGLTGGIFDETSGNFLFRYGDGMFIFSGFWSLLFGVGLIAAGLLMLLKIRTGNMLALLFGVLGTGVAVVNIIFIYSKMKSMMGSGSAAGTSASASAGAGIGVWLMLVFSALALVAGILGMTRTE